MTGLALFFRLIECYSTGLSYDILMKPKRYKLKAKKTPIHIAINNSLSNRCASTTRSAFERNLKAKAILKIQEQLLQYLATPQILAVIHQLGMRQTIQGSARAREKPNIPINGAIPPIVADSTSNVPTIGPVQKTSARAKAIKDTNNTTFIRGLICFSGGHELGNLISNAPMKEKANTINNRKNIRLKVTSVDSAFSASYPKILVTSVPKRT